MNTTCNKTELSKSGAIYVPGQLIIWAKGTKPTPCHKAWIERWHYRIYPPQYQVVACVDEGVICPQMVVPNARATSFAAPRETLVANGGLAVVPNRAGCMKVPVAQTIPVGDI